MNLDTTPPLVLAFATLGLWLTVWLGCAASIWLTWSAADWLRARRPGKETGR